MGWGFRLGGWLDVLDGVHTFLLSILTVIINVVSSIVRCYTTQYQQFDDW